MSGSPTFRDDLYRGTASYYDQYRLPYPSVLIQDLCRRTAVDGTGRLLDVACGPGTVTFAVCDQFAEVWAVDQEADAIDFAARKAADAGVRNVRWITGRAEDIDPDEVFDVVTIGTAFHRLDRRRVADLATRWLRPGGHLALLWSAFALGGSAPWQKTFTEIVVDWMEREGASDRVPADLADDITAHPHAAVLQDAGFVVLGKYEFAGIHDWTIDSLIGFMYSTSLLSRAVLGDRTEAFEADLRARLFAVEPSGIFREETTFAYDLAVWDPRTT